MLMGEVRAEGLIRAIDPVVRVVAGAGYRCVMAASMAKTIIGRPQTIARAWAAGPQRSGKSFR